MRRKPIIIILFIAVSGVALFFGVQLPTKQKYEELKQDIDSPVLRAVTLTDDDRDFINEVRRSWTIHAEECPDDTMLSVFAINDFESDVESIVDLYTHEIAPYSFFKRNRNKKEAVTAATLNMIAPISQDNCIYHTEGIAYIKLGDSLVDYYEDTDNGIRHILYRKPEEGENLPSKIKFE